MLAEHLVTKPAFDAIFSDYKFSQHNPISQALDKVLVDLDDHGFSNELADCEPFYRSVSDRLKLIDNSIGKQKIIKDMYEGFIKTALPKTATRLGVAYTPDEIIDFILHSVAGLLQEHFKRSLSDEGVHIIDPFVGTGAFIARLLQLDGVIDAESLPYKFAHEIHANDILHLSYKIAAVNIEAAYHARINDQETIAMLPATGTDGIAQTVSQRQDSYQPFQNIALTDTFSIDSIDERSAGQDSKLFHTNTKRIIRQKQSDITVIVMNPPYSGGQKSANDANQNSIHPKLRKRIQDTYMAMTDAVLKRALLDSYIKAIRWASDRIGKGGGVIGFVHNASLLRERSTQGLRRSLVDEFDLIYSFDLRGNQRTKGEQARKEGGKVFGQSSRTPVAITFLVKLAE